MANIGVSTLSGAIGGIIAGGVLVSTATSSLTNRIEALESSVNNTTTQVNSNNNNIQSGSTPISFYPNENVFRYINDNSFLSNDGGRVNFPKPFNRPPATTLTTSGSDTFTVNLKVSTIPYFTYKISPPNKNFSTKEKDIGLDVLYYTSFKYSGYYGIAYLTELSDFVLGDIYRVFFTTFKDGFWEEEVTQIEQIDQDFISNFYMKLFVKDNSPAILLTSSITEEGDGGTITVPNLKIKVFNETSWVDYKNVYNFYDTYFLKFYLDSSIVRSGLAIFNNDGYILSFKSSLDDWTAETHIKTFDTINLQTLHFLSKDNRITLFDSFSSKIFIFTLEDLGWVENSININEEFNLINLQTYSDNNSKVLLYSYENDNKPFITYNISNLSQNTFPTTGNLNIINIPTGFEIDKYVNFSIFSTGISAFSIVFVLTKKRTQKKYLAVFNTVTIECRLINVEDDINIDKIEFIDQNTVFYSIENTFLKATHGIVNDNVLNWISTT